jgi:hypothetical protein
LDRCCRLFVLLVAIRGAVDQGAAVCLDVIRFASHPATWPVGLLHPSPIRKILRRADRLAARPGSTKRSLPNMTRGETKPLSDEFSFEGSDS